MILHVYTIIHTLISLIGIFTGFNRRRRGYIPIPDVQEGMMMNRKMSIRTPSRIPAMPARS